MITDLVLYSRIESVASASGATLIRRDSPSGLPEDLDLLLVDWSARLPEWSAPLQTRTTGRVVLFGPHADLAAHADARAIGLGPMWARSKLIASLPSLMGQ